MQRLPYIHLTWVFMSCSYFKGRHTHLDYTSRIILGIYIFFGFGFEWITHQDLTPDVLWARVERAVHSHIMKPPVSYLFLQLHEQDHPLLSNDIHCLLIPSHFGSLHSVKIFPQLHYKKLSIILVFHKINNYYF